MPRVLDRLVTAAKDALDECNKIQLPKDNFVYEMDFMVRFHHSLVAGLGRQSFDSKNLGYQWKERSIGRKHIDLVIIGNDKDVAVEIEPIDTLSPIRPFLNEAMKSELKSVADKLRGISEEDVSERVILVPYIGKRTDLPFDEIEEEMRTLVGSEIELRVIH